MATEEIRIGDLVTYKYGEDGGLISGLVSDIYDDEKIDISPYPMYEVVSIDPPDRVWLHKHEMTVVNSCDKQ